MKLILSTLFIAICSIALMAQIDRIGIPLVIKKGETQKSGRLQLRYLGSVEETSVLGSDGKKVGIGIFRHRFEVTDEGNKYRFKEISSFKINGLVVEIIEKIADADAVKIVVLTEEMFNRKSLQGWAQWQSEYELSKTKVRELDVIAEELFGSYPIYANISIKKSVAEFSFFLMHSEKNEGDDFAEVFFKRIAVTNPKLNKIELKMIPKKIGIVYQIKISKQKYTVSFSHLGNDYEGVIDLNPKVTSELKQIKFYRKAG